jgi:hypothetical protein
VRKQTSLVAAAVVPALCAVLISLVTVVRPVHLSDFSLGLIVGALIGLSIVSLNVAKRLQTS